MASKIEMLTSDGSREIGGSLGYKGRAHVSATV